MNNFWLRIRRWNSNYSIRRRSRFWRRFLGQFMIRTWNNLWVFIELPPPEWICDELFGLKVPLVASYNSTHFPLSPSLSGPFIIQFFDFFLSLRRMQTQRQIPRFSQSFSYSQLTNMFVSMPCHSMEIHFEA